MQSVKGMQLAISLANCPVCDLTLILVFRPAKELSFFILCLPFFSHFADSDFVHGQRHGMNLKRGNKKPWLVGLYAAL